MYKIIEQRKLSLIIGISYMVIFITGIFANFFVIESLPGDPLAFLQQHHIRVRLGIMAFIITVVFDVIIAWALYALYKQHYLSLLSTLFRMMHAVIMAVAIFSLPAVLTSTTEQEILKHVDTFNTIWLIGLFFFGIHLILLGKILNNPKLIALLLAIAGIMYMLDTAAHFLLADYNDYASFFLALVAISGILGEMSFAIWLIVKGGK